MLGLLVVVSSKLDEILASMDKAAMSVWPSNTAGPKKHRASRGRALSPTRGSPVSRPGKTDGQPNKEDNLDQATAGV